MTVGEHREEKTPEEAVRRAERGATKGAAVGGMAYVAVDTAREDAQTRRRVGGHEQGWEICRLRLTFTILIEGALTRDASNTRRPRRCPSPGAGVTCPACNAYGSGASRPDAPRLVAGSCAREGELARGSGRTTAAATSRP